MVVRRGPRDRAGPRGVDLLRVARREAHAEVRLARHVTPRVPETPDEEILGSQTPAVESLHDETERLARIEEELRAGFDLVRDVEYAVTIFGSARVHEGDPEYELARATARELAQDGFAVITGGGPGAMEAANRGAKEGGGLSIGINIALPF